MSENCTRDCSSCHEDCGERTAIPKERLNQFSKVRKVIGIVSGKGGVGKSMVTSIMAIAMNKRGHKTAILDADITGPSIARAFGVECLTYSTAAGIAPAASRDGIDIMSMNMILENPQDPVVWRGPVIAGVVKQFWTDVVWKDEEYMFIDMPPGTGDVSLTVFQSLPVDGIIIVTSPQELVSMIVEKAVRMAEIMEIPIIGIVENMAYFECPDCGKQYNIFGESNLEEIAHTYNIPHIARMPINPKIASYADKGEIGNFNTTALNDLADVLEKMDAEWKCGSAIVAVPHEDGQIFQHFGHCAEFKFYEIVGGEITRSAIVPTEGEGHGAVSRFLAERGADAVICGGIGGGAMAALQQYGIEVFGGVEGEADTSVAAYVKGQLAYNPNACDRHDDDEEGGCCQGSEGGQCGAGGCGGCCQ